MKKICKLLSIALCICLALPNFGSFVSAASDQISVTSDNVRDLPTDLGESLIANQLPLFTDYYENSYTSERVINFDNFNLTNGVLNDSWHSSKSLFAANENGNTVVYTDGEKYYFTFTYKLKKTTDLSGICVLNHPTKNMVAGIYELYAATDYRKLFWEENKLARVENSTADCRQILKCAEKDINYVGMKFIAATQIGATNIDLKNHYPRLSEFCVYGTEKETNSFPTAVNLCSKTILTEEPLNGDIINLQDNFLLGIKETVKYNKKSVIGNSYYETSGSGNSDRLTDGGAEKGDWYTSSFKFAEKKNGEIVYHLDEEKCYVDITLDAGSAKTLGMFYIEQQGSTPLRMMHYKIYASNSKDSIVNSANLIADCYNYNGSRYHYFTVPDDVDIYARYYLIRVTDPCFDYSSKILSGDNYTNAYVRINEVAAYTKDYLEAKLKFSGLDSYGSDYGLIKSGTEVKSIINSFNGTGNVQVVDKLGNVKALNEQICIDDKIVAETGYGDKKTAGFKFCGDTNLSGMFTVSDVVAMRDAAITGVPSFDVKLGDTDSNGVINATDVAALLHTMMGTGKMVEDTSSAPTHGQKLGVATNGVRQISVATDTFINEDFRGFGSNAFPAILSEEGMAKSGLNKVYNELNKKRLATIKPTVTRMWFQVDWMVTNTETNVSASNIQNNLDYANYRLGYYDFDSPMMNAFYEYVEMLDKAGSEVEINFGWKTASRIQHWFNAPCDDFKTGAPKDLDLFGKAAAALVKELNRRGYDNITAIAFYNEPNIGDFETKDSSYPDDKDERLYWSKLIKEVDEAMEEKGVRDLIEIWGPEVSGTENSTTRDWFSYQLENTPYVDQWTGHHYYKMGAVYHNDTYSFNNYFRAFNVFSDYVELTNGNFMITEMYGNVTNDIYKTWSNWNDSTTSYLIAASNAGADGVLSWSFVGGYLPDPSSSVLTCSENSPWLIPCSEESADRVSRVFYEQSLFTNYVPDGSKVLYTGWTGDDIRASSYLLPDGNITVIVENNGIFTDSVFGSNKGERKEIKISLGDGITRTFRRISYVAETQKIESNATINSPDREIVAQNGVFSDALSEYYSVHVYTTAPIVKQVKIDDITLHATPGGIADISAKLIDCAPEDQIEYSISEYTGSEKGRVQKNGIYVASSNAKSGDMVAVRASLKGNPEIFAVAIIYID